MGATASLFDFQPPLPGIAPAARSVGQLALVSSQQDDSRLIHPISGQLRLGNQQLELQAIPPDPVQLAILPEPPPWEIVDTSLGSQIGVAPSPSTPRPADDPRQISLF